MGKLFNLDNPVWVFIGKFADVFILNLLWFICCIPIFTIGASTTALYYVTLKLAKNEEGYIIKSFFKSFLDNFKQATGIWLIMLAAGAVLGVDYFFYLRQAAGKGTLQTVLYMVFIGVLFLYLMVLTYIFPMLSRFENSVKRTFKNALFMSIRHLPWSILLVIITLGIAFLSVTYFSVLLLLGYGLIAFINSYIFVHIFQNYMPKEQEDVFEIVASLEEEIRLKKENQ